MRGHRPVIAALFGVLVTFALPAAAFGADPTPIKLSLRPVGQTGSFFDLSMRPGETRSIEVELANDGASALLAPNTSHSDVYTMRRRGGFGSRLRDEPQTGTTRWIAYPTDRIPLAAGQRSRRVLAVTVPADAGPGEYITSLVLENDQLIRGEGAVVINEVIRQAVAVVITVPGRRSPTLAIGKATHTVVAGMSVVAVALENTGNVRLKPVAAFLLLDSMGHRVSQTRVPLRLLSTLHEAIAPSAPR